MINQEQKEEIELSFISKFHQILMKALFICTLWTRQKRLMEFVIVNCLNFSLGAICASITYPTSID